ncbi:hypothetical protein GGH94_002109 [Coemansia aciculifera]|uniref:Zn(2)-C6 fungal-type domain-containing protein n=1 Tax=Coemansia aciculifera TaxID=417176 RepID=A0A9W8M7I4_9FUNG|nr:hypothetical protein GGH94_002109 [Coemansia aciculifera]KAJ2875475.1 hypothetical protein GGH93_001555 [Coemansia aciculifera]
MHSGQYNGAAEGPPHQQQQQQQRQQQQYRQYQQQLPLHMHHSHQAARQDSDSASSAQQLLQEPAHMRPPMSTTLSGGEGTMISYQSGIPPYQASMPGVAELSGSGFSHHAEQEYGGVGSSNMYPSTLLPSRQIQAQHHHHQQVLHQHLDFAPVRLLQSCDSCRRRKIRCSGEKPTCSSCVRYQEICHYSPLATPRRRAGKRARTGERETSHEHMPTTPTTASAMGAVAAEAPREVSVAPSQSAPLSADVEALSGGEFVSWSSEAGQMRRDIEGLSRKFDSLNGKLDQLIGLVGKRRRQRRQPSRSGSSVEHMEYSQNESEYSSHDEGDDHVEERRAARVGAEFSNLIDRTSRFGIDATNVGIISGMMNSIDGARGGQRGAAENVRVAAEPSSGSGLSGVQGVVQRLETEALHAELIDTFYEHADVNTISFIPRHVFQLLQREQRTPTAMTNVMMADACSHSDNADIVAVGRVFARGYFIERAYCALFECLEYDSAEHCVALLLFAMVISKAGLHRAWIMHSLSTQMAIRLRFNTLDSPISTLAFKNDSELTREWKRRVFWQLYTFDLLTTTLSDLPPCLSIHDLRCNAPTPLTDELVSAESGSGKQLAVLGPAVVFCDDQSTMHEQIEMLGILCDISSLQNMMTPEVCLFPAEFMLIHERILSWQRRMPHYDVFAKGNLIHVAEAFQQRPGLIFLGLLSQYAHIFLCLIKGTWLPTKRKMTADEEKTLTWSRQTAYESAQVVHRLVPFIRGMRLNIVCPFTLCVVFQACIVSLYSCGWNNEPRCILAAVNSVQAGLDFLEFVTPRWGFAGVLTTSLRGLVVERGFGPKDQSDNADNVSAGTNGQEPHVVASDSTASPPSIEMMRPFLVESQWERILRTGEMPSLPKS